MERSRTPLSSAARLLAVVSAVGLAAGYVIFAQVNGSKQSATSFPVPPLKSQTESGMKTDYIDTDEMAKVVQSSSKSGVLTHEATAIVAGGLMGVGPVRMITEAPPTPIPTPYLISSSKNMPLKREAEALISVAGLKALPPAPTIPPVPNVPLSGFAPFILPAATPLPAGFVPLTLPSATSLPVAR